MLRTNGCSLEHSLEVHWQLCEGRFCQSYHCVEGELQEPSQDPTAHSRTGVTGLQVLGPLAADCPLCPLLSEAEPGGSVGGRSSDYSPECLQIGRGS